MSNRILEAEGSTLGEARDSLRSQLDNEVLLEEQILQYPLIPDICMYADSAEEALRLAESLIEAEAVVKRKEVTEPTRWAIEIEAEDESAARKTAADAHGVSTPSHRIVSVTIERPGRRGLFGIGMKPTLFALTVAKQSRACIKLTRKARIRWTVGSAPTCARCEKRLMKNLEFENRCAEAGLVLVNGNLYGYSGEERKIQLYEELQGQKGFVCKSCGEMYCQTCLFNDAPMHPTGGKACFDCGGRFEAH